jgi:4-hydroxy-2-oxoheptanedioate aldolase
MQNISLNKWRSGEKSLGIWSILPDIHMAEMFVRMEADWICFDLQHGLMSHSDLTRLLPAICGQAITPLVRVAANQADQIGKALDAGAQGVIVPLVNSAEEARRAVAACRYPPQGNRSFGPMRDTMIEGMNYLQTANDQVACVVMIETEEGLRNVEGIAEVEGLDGLFIGPMDLCFGIGLPPGSLADAAFTDAVAAILAACKKHRRAAGIFGVTPEMVYKALQDGFDFASVGTDVSFIQTGAAQALTIARGKAAPPADGSARQTGY